MWSWQFISCWSWKSWEVKSKGRVASRDTDTINYVRIFVSLPERKQQNNLVMTKIINRDECLAVTESIKLWTLTRQTEDDNRKGKTHDHQMIRERWKTDVIAQASLIILIQDHHHFVIFCSCLLFVCVQLRHKTFKRFIEDDTSHWYFTL